MRRPFVFALFLPLCLQAQTSSGGPPPARATKLPLSGNTQSSPVSTQQTSVMGSGAATVSSSVQVGGNFAGSVTTKDAATGPLALTLADAVRRGLAANLGPISADNSSRAARGARLESLSSLLPNITASASDTVTQTNLAAFGFQFNVPPSVGFSIPTVVGPYNYSSLQASMSQSIFDATARRNWRAAREQEKAAILNARDARELVVLAVGGTYLQTVATAARVVSQRAQVENADAIYRQADVRRQAGTNARIDVTRSEVELQTAKQRLSSLEADLRKQKIGLARLIGLPQDLEINFTDPLSGSDGTLPETTAAIQRALTERSDLRALEAQVKAAETALSAARGERLPSASLSGHYGVIGSNPEKTHGEFVVTGAVSVPIWQGGRIKADILQAQATLDQRQAELNNYRGKIEQDVRTALIEMETAAGQIKLAESNKGLANETLTQSRDRFAAGVATTVEVVQAQQQVADAESDYISSLFSFNLAKLSLARATGDAERSLGQK